MNPADHEEVAALIELARREDLGHGDITSALLADPRAFADFRVWMNAPGVFAGRPIAEAVLRAYDDTIASEWSTAAMDGGAIRTAPCALAMIRGPIGSVLAAERVMLNFLQRLCGVATLTRRFVDAVAGIDVHLRDTRKTVPGWRVLDKYAVRCGGGQNHRFGLFDAVLIKDNHLTGVPPERIAATVFHMLNARSLVEDQRTPVIVEAETLEQVEALLSVVGVDVVLLDNFSLERLRAAAELREKLGLAGRVQLEASGGVTLENIRAIAETGVDRISIGALTHSAAGLDLSLERVG
jgi:nicotinate-nucleotide pyrophosphorylase (carboxylating)